MKDGESLLDVGCREARLMQFFRFSGVRYVGVDSSEVAISLANQRFPDSARLASAESLPFPDKSFDKVVMCHVIEHVEHPDKAISEVRRVLKDDGRFVLSYPNRYYFLYLLGLVKQDKPHRRAFSSLQKWDGFKVIRKRIFPPLHDGIPLNRAPLLREVLYNVVLLLEKKSFGVYE